MTVSSFHSKYIRRIEGVKRMRALIEGGVAVHSLIETMPGHTDAEKDLYRKKAYYLPAVSRTIDAFVGMIMSPEPVITGAPEKLTELLQDATNNGEPIMRVAAQTVREVVTSARMFGLVDYPDVDPKTTIAQAEKARHRPYIRLYPFEDVINWKTENVDGLQMLTSIRLVELYTVEGIDEWDSYQEPQIRVLDIYEGKYRQRIYRQKPASQDKTKSGSRMTSAREAERSKIMADLRAKLGQVSFDLAADWEQHGGDIFPQMGGKPLTEIPGVAFGPGSLDPSQLAKSPLDEMGQISISHLNNSASREWALMWCGAPTLVVAGDPATDADGKPLPIKIGSSQAIILGEGGSASLLQMGAEAVGAIDKAMEGKRRDMSAMGGRILIDSGSGQISTETAKMERIGEHSVLAEISNTVGDGLTKLVRWLAEWAKITLPKDFKIELNTDFVPSGLQAGELQEWVAALQTGKLPLAVFLARMKSRGVVDPEMSEDDYRRHLDEDADLMDMGEDEEDDEDEPHEEGDEDGKKPPIDDPKQQKQKEGAE